MWIEKLLYIGIAVGLVFFQFGNIKVLLLSFVRRRKLTRNLGCKTDSESYRNYGTVLSKIKRVLDGAGSFSFAGRPEYFLVFSIMLATFVFIILFGSFGVLMSSVFGIISGFIPFSFLYVKLSSRRVAGSREGDILLSELLSQYRMHAANIREAVTATAVSVKGAPNSKRVFLLLSKDLGNAYTRSDVKRAIGELRYSLNTAWGNALASAIYAAYVDGIDIDAALSDLSESLTKSKRVVEQAKRENNEAVLMLKYLAPISYALSIFLAVKFFDFGITKFFKYQFTTNIGLAWLAIMIVVYIIGVLMEALLSKEKMDI